MARLDLKEYRIWKAMKSRCYAPAYRNNTYQKNGIQVCPEWRESFEKFLQDMGPIPGDDYSIERIDVYGDYCPENCIWLPMKEQAKNRTSCKFYTIGNETKTLKDWARTYGIKYTTVYMRIYRHGVSIEEALEINI